MRRLIYALAFFVVLISSVDALVVNNKDGLNVDSARKAIATKDGFWTFEKATDYYGMHPENKDIPDPELDAHYKNSFVEFGRGNVYISCLYENLVYSIEEIEFEDFFRSKLELTETNATIKNYFKQRFDVEMGNTLFLLCPSAWAPDFPYYFLVFPNKFIIVKSGEFFASFVKNDTFSLPKQTDSFGGICVEKPIVMGHVLECVYENKTLAEAYELLRKKYPAETRDLKKTLPATDISYESSLGENTPAVSVSYTYKSADHLVVELYFSISMVYLELVIMEDNQALIRITGYAD